jgi:hypothetical protein
MPPRHPLGRLFNEGANVFDLPSRRAWPKFHRLRKAPGLDAFPPSGPSYWNRSARRENGGQPDKAAVRKIVLVVFSLVVRLIKTAHQNPIRQSDGASDDVSLEFIVAPARLDPLLLERGLNPAKSRIACRRATLFLRLRRTHLCPATHHCIECSGRLPPSIALVHSPSTDFRGGSVGRTGFFAFFPAFVRPCSLVVHRVVHSLSTELSTARLTDSSTSVWITDEGTHARFAEKQIMSPGERRRSGAKFFESRRCNLECQIRPRWAFGRV